MHEGRNIASATVTFSQEDRLCARSLAHTEVSTGVLAQDVTFHDEFDARRWLLIDHEAQATGGGRTYRRGHVFTEDGRLVASFVQEALLRRFPADQDRRGKTSTIF